ncbi:MAG: hypothetical protein WC343_10415 [Bacilli bacterium]|jgi:hypothetical protein
MSSSAISIPFYEKPPGSVSSYDVEGDLSALTNTFVQLDTVRPRTVKAWTSGMPVGVLTNAPAEDATSTKLSLTATVQKSGIALVKAGSGGLAIDDLVKVDTGGVGVKATPSAGDIIVGKCVFAAAQNGNASVELFKTYYASA